MSTNVHSVILMPGSTARLICQNGLSPIDVQHIKQIINFGGKLKFIHCTVSNEFIAQAQAYMNMADKARSSRGRAKADFNLAKQTNLDNYSKFYLSNIFQAWFKQPGPDKEENLFQTLNI